METILVTGGAGFIGSAIVEALTGSGFRVVILDDLSSGRLENIDHLMHRSNVVFVRGSILDRGLLRSVIRTYQVSGISHQAAVTGVAKSMLDPVKTIETNITGTAAVFDIAAESRCRRVVFASSHTVYGDESACPKQEQMAQRPGSVFAMTKAAKEMLARNFSDLHSLEIVGLRYFTVYGKRQNPASDRTALIPNFVTRAIRNEPLEVEGDGLQTRDFVHIDDAAQANVLALSAKNASGRCFNIGTGCGVSVLSVAGAVIRLAASSSQIVHRPPRPGGCREIFADIGLARTCLGFSPQVPLEKGLADTIAWFRQRAGSAEAVKAG